MELQETWRGRKKSLLFAVSLAEEEAGGGWAYVERSIRECRPSGRHANAMTYSG